MARECKIMEQKNYDALFEQAVNVGINTSFLERVGYMDILLAGEETPPINLRLRTEHNAVV